MVRGGAEVLAGSLLDFDLRSVVAVVSTSRQLTGIELSDDTSIVLGTLFVKSGDIFAARMGVRSGLDAVQALLRNERATRFNAFRVSDPGDVKPLLSIQEAFARLPRRISTVVATVHEENEEAADTDDELLVSAEIAEPRQCRRTRR